MRKGSIKGQIVPYFTVWCAYENCATFLELEAKRKSAGVIEAKQKGWMFARIGWVCPECAKKHQPWGMAVEQRRLLMKEVT